MLRRLKADSLDFETGSKTKGNGNGTDACTSPPRCAGEDAPVKEDSIDEEWLLEDRKCMPVTAHVR